MDREVQETAEQAHSTNRLAPGDNIGAGGAPNDDDSEGTKADVVYVHASTSRQCGGRLEIARIRVIVVQGTRQGNGQVGRNDA
jgi:hypothetical protein